MTGAAAWSSGPCKITDSTDVKAHSVQRLTTFCKVTGPQTSFCSQLISTAMPREVNWMCFHSQTGQLQVTKYNPKYQSGIKKVTAEF